MSGQDSGRRADGAGSHSKKETSHGQGSLSPVIQTPVDVQPSTSETNTRAAWYPDGQDAPQSRGIELHTRPASFPDSVVRRKWVYVCSWKKAANTLGVTSDKEGADSVFEKEGAPCGHSSFSAVWPPTLTAEGSPTPPAQDAITAGHSVRTMSNECRHRPRHHRAEGLSATASAWPRARVCDPGPG